MTGRFFDGGEYIPQRPRMTGDAPCVLYGRKFSVVVCRRCGYRRNAADTQYRYARCVAPPSNDGGSERIQAPDPSIQRHPKP